MSVLTSPPPAAAPRPRVAAAVGRRALLAVAAALAVAAVWLPLRPPLVCFLRAVTGIPCPFCGGTTAMGHLGAGRPEEAFATSPLATLAAPLWVLWPVWRDRAVLLARRAGRRRTAVVLVLLMTASWIWQVERVLG